MGIGAFIGCVKFAEIERVPRNTPSKNRQSMSNQSSFTTQVLGFRAEKQMWPSVVVLNS